MAAGTKPPPAKVAKPAKDDPAKLALARQQYAQAGALPGTPAAAYLQKRGLGHTDAWDRLRASVLWHPMRGPCPVLIASIDGPDGSMVGLHRHYLQPNGTKLDVANPRLPPGPVRGGPIRHGEAPGNLLVGEGLAAGMPPPP